MATQGTINIEGNAVKQVYQVVNLIASQVMGNSAITVTDTGSFVALGKEVTNSQGYVEAFLNVIPDVLARTIISSRAYMTGASSMIKYAFEFGTYIRKIYVNMPEAEVSAQWEIGKEDFVPEYAPVIKSDVRVEVFSGFTSWQMGVTIPDNALRTAFTSPTEMAVFISAIFTALENSMKMAIENLSDLTRANFIGWKISKKSTCGAINLLEGYNTFAGTSLTVQQALKDEDALAWMAAQMVNWSKRMERMSTRFNEKGYQRHTPREYQVCEVLQDFESYINTFLKRISFQANLVELPNYSTVPYWQGSGTGYAWEDISSINLKLGKSADETADVTIQQSNIVAVLYDIEALGITINERASASERNQRAKYTDYWEDANFGYFNDLSENGIVFYLAEPATPPTPQTK